MLLKNRLIQFVAFGCLGTTTEIWFTAFRRAIDRWSQADSIDLSLAGHSYVWMFPIYGSAALLFPLFFPLIARRPIILRLLIYMVGIFVVEYVAGAVLDSTTGRCPWHYESRWAISGYIRLDYGPFWMVFGYGIERVFLLLNSVFPMHEDT